MSCCGNQEKCDSISSSTGVDGRFEIALEEVANRHGVNDDAAGAGDLLATLRGGAGDERGAVHQRHQFVVVARDGAFGEDHQRSLAVDEDVDRRVDRLPIDPFAIDAERPDAAEHEAAQPAFHEQMPRRHRVEVALGDARELHERQRIGESAVVRRQDRAVAGGERRLQLLAVAGFDGVNAVGFLDPVGNIVAQQFGPDLGIDRGNELVRLFDDDVLHP